MEDAELVERFPRLFHMAAAGSWPTIRTHGLLSTRWLVDRCDPDPPTRARVLDRRRDASVVLRDPDGGDVVVRDQSPLREHILTRVLTDLTVAQWLDVLNDRVFFWLDPERLAGLLRARRYRRDPHDVLTVDTENLLAAHGDRVRLSALNSGATLYPNAPPRGSGTFRTVAEHPWPARRPVELAVIDGVEDLVDHLVRVERRHPDGRVETLWEGCEAP